MKLHDKETLSIAAAVKDVLENWPDPLYSPEGKKVQAKSKEEHEELKKKGYTYDKTEVKEVDEPRAKGEKEFKAKHVAKKSGMNTDGTNIKEDKPSEIKDQDELSPKQKKYQAFFKKALKKFGVKSPSELEDEKRKEFFNYIDKNYDAGEGESD